MANEDFDIDGLAKYLHFTPQQIEKLANRGRLPGRKIAGRWRFARAEVHRWMEERIGLLEGDELADVEGKLRQSAGSTEEHPEVTLADLLRPATIAHPLSARTRGSVIAAMADLGVEAGLLWDPRRLIEAIRAREEMQSTAVGKGVALMHPRRPMPGILAEGYVALGITVQGIPFGGGRQLTDVFFLICSVDDRSHLRTLARISRLIADEALLSSLRQAAGAEEVHDLLIAAEEGL
jgi:PTS system nitrogen regulatory IIA component